MPYPTSQEIVSRLRRSMTLDAIATETGLSRTTVHAIEKGNRKCNEADYRALLVFAKVRAKQDAEAARDLDRGIWTEGLGLHRIGVAMRLTSVPLIGGKCDGVQVPADSRIQISFPECVGYGLEVSIREHIYERKRLFLDLYVPRDMPADEAASLLLRNYQPAATREARALLTRLVQLDTEQLRNFSGCELHRLERIIYEAKELLR